MSAGVNFFHAIREASTVEDFICAIGDLGDPETGDCSEWDEQELIDVLNVIVEVARGHQSLIDSSQSRLSRLRDALVDAKEGLKNPDKRSTALHAVSLALRE